MNHCGGGPAALDEFDMLGAMVDWVENGKAPEAVDCYRQAVSGAQPPAMRISKACAI